MKQICPIHRFSYNGKKCPFCEQERLANIAKKFVVTDHTEVIGEYKPFVLLDHSEVLGNYNPKTSNDIDITEEQLKKLTEKFNVKKR